MIGDESFASFLSFQCTEIATPSSPCTSHEVGVPHPVGRHLLLAQEEAGKEKQCSDVGREGCGGVGWPRGDMWWVAARLGASSKGLKPALSWLSGWANPAAPKYTRADGGGLAQGWLLTCVGHVHVGAQRGDRVGKGDADAQSGEVDQPEQGEAALELDQPEHQVGCRTGKRATEQRYEGKGVGAQSDKVDHSTGAPDRLRHVMAINQSLFEAVDIVDRSSVESGIVD